MTDVPIEDEDEYEDEHRTGSGYTVGEGEAYNVQCSLQNLYEDIRDGQVLPGRDAAPVFDDGYVLTGELANTTAEEANDALYIGRVFTNKAEMQMILAIHAIKRLFAFKQDKTDKHRLIVSCVDSNCPWRVYGRTMGGHSENIEIRTMRLTHTCDVATRSKYGNKASSKVIAEVLKQKFANGKKGPRPVEIPDIVLTELRVSISYMKAWYAKERAVATARGTKEASYKLLMAYLRLLVDANPGTVYNVKSNSGEQGQTRFKYLFFALGASVAGIPYMRQVVIIDGTAIKAKYQGCMMTASLQDGNFQVFPVGFGVVDGENDPAWTWFFTQLKEIIPDSENLMFVSDRHSSIYAAINKVYPLAQHGACSVHLYRNIKHRFKRQRTRISGV